jgi:glycosyltransferase involved in cell wall biosynthesis
MNAAGAPGDPVRRLRVLVVHNAYQQRGGEDAVVEAECELLAANGHAVERYGRHNDEIASLPRLSLAAQTLWSPRTHNEVKARIQGFKPDVIHVHNSIPLISPSVYWAAASAGVPVVQTLHNFRLLCPQAMLLREGRICEDCVARPPWRAVAHGCYRGSRTQSAVLAGMLQGHRWLGTWRDKVTVYIALNEFCRRKFIEGGLPAERIRVKPNFVDLPAPPAGTPRDGLLFVGRLSHEKGVDVLAQAVALAGEAMPVLRVAGSGPDGEGLGRSPGVQMLGALAPAAVYEQMRRARALVLPSVWYEAFPRTIVEAFANGLPVVASRLGALPELVQDGHTGILFEPGNAADLAAKLAWVKDHPDEMAQMGLAARKHFERTLTGTTNHSLLLAIYDQALEAH